MEKKCRPEKGEDEGAACGRDGGSGKETARGRGTGLKRRQE